jgi:Tfp pilus assembly protein PilX
VRNEPTFRARRGQQGVTLFVALVMLVMVTLLAVSSFRVSNTNLKVIASTQGKGEATSAAQAAIESTLSSSNFASNPAGIAATPVNVDLTGDGTIEYVVSMTPAPKCLKSRPTDPTTLDISNPNDRPCFGSAIVGQVTTASSCADTIWEVTATTQDTVTSATTTVRQGVSMRVSVTDAISSCS